MQPESERRRKDQVEEPFEGQRPCHRNHIRGMRIGTHRDRLLAIRQEQHGYQEFLKADLGIHRRPGQ